MDNTKKDVQEATRASRETSTREKQARRKPWSPPSALDAPPPPEGYEPVRAEEYPDFESPTIEDGKHAGCIGVGGLVLARIPEETIRERTDYFNSKTEGQMDAVDNDYFRDGTHSSMSVAKPNRQSRVTLGGSRKADNK